MKRGVDRRSFREALIELTVPATTHHTGVLCCIIGPSRTAGTGLSAARRWYRDPFCSRQGSVTQNIAAVACNENAERVIASYSALSITCRWTPR